MHRRRRNLSRAALLLGLLLASASQAAEPPSYETVVEWAAASATAGDWAAAARLLDAHAARFGEDFPFQLTRAYYHLRGGRFDESAAAYRRALALNPESGDAKLGLADALLGGKRWAEADPILARLVEGSPDDAQLLDRHGLALFSLGRLDEAEARYARALASKKDDAQALCGLGWVALRRERVPLARTRFEEALAIDPGLASAREGLAALPAENSYQLQLHLGGESSGVAVNGGGKLQGLELVFTAGLEALLADRWLAGATWRHFGALSTQGAGAGAGSLLSGQDEGYLLAGYTTPAWGVAGHFAWLAPASTAGTSRRRTAAAGLGGPMFGASARVEAGVQWLGSTAYTLYDDGLNVFQFHLSVSRELIRWLSLSAGGRFQAGGGDWYQSVLLAAKVRLGGWRLALGSDFGDQLRPVELDGPAVYNITGLRTFSGFAALTIPFSDSVAGVATYRYELYRNGSGAGAETGLQRVTFGLNLSL